MSVTAKPKLELIPADPTLFRQALREVATVDALLTSDASCFCVIAPAISADVPYEILLNKLDGSWTTGARNTRNQPELTLTRLDNAFVDTAVVLGWNKLSGGVYRSDGMVCPDFRVRTGHQAPPATDHARISAAKFVSGTHIYLGQLNDVYGHFIIETLGRCWALGHLKDFDGTFVMQRVRKSKFSQNDTYGTLMKAAGIDLSRVRIVEQDTRFESLIVPTAAADLGKSVHDVQKKLYQDIAKDVAAQTAQTKRASWFDLSFQRSAPAAESRLYLSRRKLDLGVHKFLNEAEIERIFIRYGFAIIFPETLTLRQQLALYSKADHIGGGNSSALHNNVFAPDGCKLIMLDARTGVHGQADWVQVSLCHAYNQPLSVMECESALHIDGISRGRMPYLCDLKKLQIYLDRVVGAPADGGVLIETVNAPTVTNVDDLVVDLLISLAFWMTRNEAYTMAEQAVSQAKTIRPDAKYIGRLKRMIRFRSLKHSEKKPPTIRLMPGKNSAACSAIDEATVEELRAALKPYTS